MDVKVGNGAFMTGLSDARTLARSLVQVAAGAGLRCQALITDMNQVLGHSAGNALEVAEAIAFLTGAAQEPRLREVTLALAAQMLHCGGLAPTLAAALALADAALASGRAAECFAHMVAGLGGPADVLADARLAAAPVLLDVPAPRSGVLAAMDTRALGLVVVALGGGRRRASDAVDARVGLSQVLPLGTLLRAGDALLRIHAADENAAALALRGVLAAMTVADSAVPGGPVVIDAVDSDQ